MQGIIVSAPAPRVNFELMGQHLGKRVRLVGKVEGIQGNSLTLRAADDGLVTVALKGAAPSDLYIEVEGTVDSPNTLQEESCTAFGNSFGAGWGGRAGVRGGAGCIPSLSAKLADSAQARRAWSWGRQQQLLGRGGSSMPNATPPGHQPASPPSRAQSIWRLQTCPTTTSCASFPTANSGACSSRADVGFPLPPPSAHYFLFLRPELQHPARMAAARCKIFPRQVDNGQVGARRGSFHCGTGPNTASGAAMPAAGGPR